MAGGAGGGSLVYFKSHNLPLTVLGIVAGALLGALVEWQVDDMCEDDPPDAPATGSDSPTSD